LLKKILILFYIFAFSVLINAADKMYLIHTILVVVEESENNELLLKESPAADGVFEELWNYEQFIFFDVKLKERLKITNGELDAADFALQAKDAGADSILLIKFSYTSKSDGDKVIFNNGDAMYKLVSLNRLDTVRIGKINLGLNESILKKEKYGRLKKIGDNTIKNILK
jgi:hypothetical protein